MARKAFQTLAKHIKMLFNTSVYRIDHLLADLYSSAQSQGLSKRKCALLTGMHPNTLRRFGREDWAPSPNTLRKMEEFLFHSSHPAQISLDSHTDTTG